MKAIVSIKFMYVCLCHGVTERAIRSELARGACTPEDIAACTRAGTKCGRCVPEIAALVEEETPRHGLPVLRSQSAA